MLVTRLGMLNDNRKSIIETDSRSRSRVSVIDSRNGYVFPWQICFTGGGRGRLASVAARQGAGVRQS